MYDLKTMCALVRTRLKDLRVKTFHEFEIIAFLNEGKNELVKIIRGADENFFETAASLTISTTTFPNFTETTLPTDFAELRNLRVTTSGYESTEFYRLNQSDKRFMERTLYGPPQDACPGIFYYDFVGLDKIRFSPPPLQDMAITMDYISTVPDMMYPGDTMIGTPREHWDFVVTWAVCEGLRSLNDPRLPSYENKLKLQITSVINAVNSRQSKEPTFVRGFLEAEQYW